MRFLLTAFEPFDGTGLNASLESCRLFLEQWGKEYDLRFCVLPVEYGPDTLAVEQALAGGEIDAILHTGQAAGSSRVRVERIAVNVRYGESGGALDRSAQALIEPGAPPAYFSTLPVDEMCAAIAREGVPVEVSNHAGIYLCNHVLYQSLRRAERSGDRPHAGFLHVPCLPEQAEPDAPSLAAEATARAIRAALSAVGSS